VSQLTITKLNNFVHLIPQMRFLFNSSSLNSP